MSHHIESIFHHKELKCCVIFTMSGHRCGYVGVPKGHPLFGIDYNQDIKSPELVQELLNSELGKRGIISAFCWDGESASPGILFNVHGGITYSGGSTSYPTNQIDPVWWFGFDCAHCYDAKDWAMMKKLFEKKKWQPIWAYEQEFHSHDGIIRSKEYAEDECKALAEQINCVTELLKQTRSKITT